MTSSSDRKATATNRTHKIDLKESCIFGSIFDLFSFKLHRFLSVYLHLFYTHMVHIVYLHLWFIYGLHLWFINMYDLSMVYIWFIYIYFTRIWSILLIKSDKNGVYILVEVSVYICYFSYKEGHCQIAHDIPVPGIRPLVPCLTDESLCNC